MIPRLNEITMKRKQNTILHIRKNCHGTDPTGRNFTMFGAEPD